MSVPRKHHYLPQFYLEGFKIEPQQGKKPHIWQIEKSGEQVSYSPAIEDTGCIRDYHSLDVADQEPDHHSIESLLSKLEAEQAALVRSICETRRIDASQIESLAVFISSLRHRVPAYAGHIEKSLKSIVLDSFKIMYNAGKFSVPPPQLREAFEQKGIDQTIRINISNWKIVCQMFNVALSPESIGLLSQYTYHLYSTAGADFFITSDNPVALYHPGYDQIRPYGVGLALKGVEVTLALNSNTLVRAGRHIEPGASIASSEEVEEFNRRAIIMSERYIFTGAVTDELRRRIGQLKDVRAGFVFDNLFYGDGSYQISRFIPVR